MLLMELTITFFVKFVLGAKILLAFHYFTFNKILKFNSKLNFSLFNTYLYKFQNSKIISFSLSKSSQLMFVNEKFSCD
ncbi:hypothetical protein B0A66_11240 [Flavobacterium hercynium]|uniref:Uncharacterized protein n=1 Tax=Flavobacterium hercynium TaxID=387094 RepID=A0A226HCK0_9FLAO|nr:hypothetical protein B0A66_11240 [Flavobacterium hercynium]